VGLGCWKQAFPEVVTFWCVMKAHGKRNHSSSSAFFTKDKMNSKTEQFYKSNHNELTEPLGKQQKIARDILFVPMPPPSDVFDVYPVAAKKAMESKATDATETANLADLVDAMKVTAAMVKQKKKLIGFGGCSFAAAEQPDSLEQFLELGCLQQQNPSDSFLPTPSKGGNQLPSVTGAKQNGPPSDDESCHGRRCGCHHIVKAFQKKEATDATTVAAAVKKAPVGKAGTWLAVPQQGWICPTCLGWVVDMGCGSCVAPALVAAAAAAAAVTEAPISWAGTLLAVPRKSWKCPTCLPWGTEMECDSCEAPAPAAADHE